MAKLEDYTALILKECASQNMSNFSDVIRAIVSVESAYNPNAMRYEKLWVYYHKEETHAKVQKITVETEKALQRFSYGLGQIMGGTARWLGFSGHLPALLEPDTNLYWVIKYFKKVCSPHVYLNDQIAAYNAGSVKRDAQTGKYFNQDYVDRVLAALLVIQDRKPKVYQPN